MRCDLTIVPILTEAAYFSFFTLESDMLMHTIDYIYKSVCFHQSWHKDGSQSYIISHVDSLSIHIKWNNSTLPFPLPTHACMHTHTHTHTHTQGVQSPCAQLTQCSQVRIWNFPARVTYLTPLNGLYFWWNQQEHQYQTFHFNSNSQQNLILEMPSKVMPRKLLRQAGTCMGFPQHIHLHWIELKCCHIQS